MKFIRTTKIAAVLTSGVLAFSVIATGCGKVDKDEDSDKKSGSLSLTSALSAVSATMEKAQKMITGNADTAYNSNLNVDFGPMASTLIGAEVKPIDLSSVSKSKNGLFAQEFTLKYDGNNAVSMNLLFDNAEKAGYVQIPELSKGYIKATESDLNSLMTEMGLTGNSVTDILTQSADAGMTADSAALAESIEKIIPDYVNYILEQLPEGKATDDLKETIGDVKVSLTAKKAEISDSQAIEIAIKTLEKAKTDENIIALLDNRQVQEMLTESTGTSFDKAAYATAVQSMIDELNNEKATATGETVQYTVYYNGKDMTGISFPLDGGNLKCYSYADGSDFATVMNMQADNTTIDYRFSGTEKNDKLNASGTITITEDSQSVAINLEMKDLAVLDNGTFTGTVTASANIPSVGEVSMTAASKSTEKKTDLSMDLSYAGQSVVTITYTGEETAASDITLPGSDVYSYSNDAEMDAYTATLDMEGFETNLKTVLGDEIFNMLFSGADADMTNNPLDDIA